MNDKKCVDFDDYADRYEDLLKKQLSFFSKDREYFSRYKVELIVRYFSISPKKILDFGCGIGLSLPYLAHYFPEAQLFATDLSQKSLTYVHEKHPKVSVIGNEQLKDHSFDLIFVTGVMHHVPLEYRTDVVKQLASLLTDNGRLCIFEHNPYNLVTQRMVSTCPFDQDAVLLPLPDMKKLLTSQALLRIEQAKYCLFFPEVLQSLRVLENLLSWLPLGGQYYVVASR